MNGAGRFPFRLQPCTLHSDLPAQVPRWCGFFTPHISMRNRYDRSTDYQKHIGIWSPGADEANCMQCAKLNRIVHRCGFFTKTERSRSFHLRSCSSWDEIGIPMALASGQKYFNFIITQEDVFNKYSKPHVCESYQ